MALSMFHQQGYLNAPIGVMENSSDDEPNSMSSSESSTDDKGREYTKTIDAPVEFLKKNNTIQRLEATSVTSRDSHKGFKQASEKSLMNRPRRRKGVSDRRTLTFSR